MKTEAAILVETDQPLKIVELDTPELKAGQVLVKILYSGICHTQLLEARGYRGEDKFLPHCLGHEGVGVVTEIGPGVRKVRTDDNVILSWIKGSIVLIVIIPSGEKTARDSNKHFLIDQRTPKS